MSTVGIGPRLLGVVRDQIGSRARQSKCCIRAGVAGAGISVDIALTPQGRHHRWASQGLTLLLATHTQRGSGFIGLGPAARRGDAGVMAPSSPPVRRHLDLYLDRAPALRTNRPRLFPSD